MGRTFLQVVVRAEVIESGSVRGVELSPESDEEGSDRNNLNKAGPSRTLKECTRARAHPHKHRSAHRRATHAH